MRRSRLRSGRRRAILGARRAVVLSLALLLVSATAVARLEVRVFAQDPAMTYPANAVLSPDGSVYAGTFKSLGNPSDTGPSKVFKFSPAGKLLRTYPVVGQTKGVADAVQVSNIDRNGILYLLDQDPARVIKLDPRTGKQTTWATFASVPACAGAPNGACTDGPGGSAPEPDFSAWGPDGSLYVTDYSQLLIWRIPPGGGKAIVWLTDPQFNGGMIVGPAGIQLLADNKTLMFDTGGGGSNPATGKLYTVAIGPGGKPGPIKQLWESAAAEAPDGFAVARSGHVYIALVGPSGNAVVEISPGGLQIARVPGNAVANQALPVPFDAPGSVTFDGNQIIVGNQSAIMNDNADMALLAVAVGEPGLAPSLPPAPKPKPKPKPHRHKRCRTNRRCTTRRK